MFPCKRFDQEERLAEQARRHARVLDAAYGEAGVAGAIGWCAFDYNTHREFGSGDRVCYHGVSDMFRIPKYAAAVYASQVDPAERVVLEVASLFARGERDSAFLTPIEIWTNCDEIILWRGGERVGSFLPAHDEYPHLPHPPVVIRDLVGDRLEGHGLSRRDQGVLRMLIGTLYSKGYEALRWRDLARLGFMTARRRMTRVDFEGFVSRFGLGWGAVDETFELVGFFAGKEVARKRYRGDAHATRLAMEADDTELAADGIDVTRVVLSILDQYDNLHPFTSEAVALSIEGPGEIIGPRLLPLAGGVAAFWVRTRRKAGTMRITAHGSRFSAKPVTIEVL
jgi:beta-galactosidase